MVIQDQRQLPTMNQLRKSLKIRISDLPYPTERIIQELEIYPKLGVKAKDQINATTEQTS